MAFVDRVDAGRQLGARLAQLEHEDAVVLGLPRGGVPVAYEVARALGAPLDVIVVRKLGVPSQPELAMGAIGEDGVRVLNEEIVQMAGVSEGQLGQVEAREREELDRRARRFRGDRRRTPIAGRRVVIVDDGIATGSTARAACQVARAEGAIRVVLAAPVAAPSSIARLRADADEVVCLDTPERFYAIGQWYSDFSQTPDDTVVDLLRRAAEEADPSGPKAPDGAAPDGGRSSPLVEEVKVEAGEAVLDGLLSLPASPRAVVLFAHGSGSSRHSPRNRLVSAALAGAGLASLLFDLLDVREERQRANVFDIDLLGRRLAGATRWLQERPDVGGLPIGYFGASTGAAAALRAAAEPGSPVGAVVSRGGRPDLAEPYLGRVTAPVLLVVGELDSQVLDLNRQSRRALAGDSHLAVVPGATHLFDEPGALEAVAELARDWFVTHLAGPGRPPR